MEPREAASPRSVDAGLAQHAMWHVACCV